jgi:crotonobetainyl-CoA:carnitine CoA-transferase CaiB-like acyl-CoA transferase
MQPFEDIRVLDLTHVLAGPFCTFQLACLGADVIKIEAPDKPDMTRDEGVSDTLNAALRGTYFMAQSAGKRSIILDLKSDKGQAAFQKLVKAADVLVHNYAGDVPDRLGLDYDTLAKINPRLIHCSMSGFGRTGPKAGHPAYDVVIQAYSGLMMANGWADGDAPLRVGPPMVDYGTGAQAAFAISAALFHRERTGQGQQIDVAMADAAVMLMSAFVTDTIATGKMAQRHGNTHPSLPSYSAYETADGWIMLGAYTVKQCAALMRVLGFNAEATEIAAMTKHQMGTRAENDRVLIFDRLKNETAQYWEDALNAAHVPAARVRRIEETLAEAQFASRQVAQSYGVPVGQGGPNRLPTAAFSFAHGGPKLAGPPPGFGEHTDEILLEIGLSGEEIREMKKLGGI